LKTPKKVLLLSQFSPPETGSAANRVAVMAGKLTEHYRVCLVTLKPSYPSTSRYKGLQLERHDRALPYETKRAFSFHPHKGGLLVRAVREHAMAIRLMVRAALTPADIVLTSSPSMFLGPAALVLAKAKRAKFVWDIRDVTWRYAKEFADSSGKVAPGLRALEKYMMFVLRRADLIVGATSGITGVLIEGGLAPEKAITVPNGVSEEVLEVAHAATDHGSRPARPKVVYAGLIGYNQGLEVLLDVADILPNVDFILAGDGPALPLLKERASQLKTANVSFRGYLSRGDLLKVYAEGDVLFAKVRSTPTLDATSVPSKLFEYMATGRPLVYAGRGLAVEFLSKIGCALTIPPEDPRAISTAISALLQDPERMRALGLKGRAFVEQNFRRDRLMEELAHTLKERFAH
jgi:glycosyltransferase involved in cell wall biosynthesis